MIYTPHLSTVSGSPTILSDISSGLVNSYVNVSHDSMLPMIPEGAHFGDNLCCETINSCGCGEQFAKIEVVVDFAVDEGLDFVFVTELKTT